MGLVLKNPHATDTFETIFCSLERLEVEFILNITLKFKFKLHSTRTI
jgi:hypothetical protein